MTRLDRLAATVSDALPAERLRRFAWVWLLTSLGAAAFYVFDRTRVGLTDGANYPLGDDFINFWSGAVLAARGQAATAFDFARFRAFEIAAVGAHGLQPYHYGYPPPMLLLCRPLASLPYVPAWAVWTVGGWVAFAAALRRLRPGRDTTLFALAAPALLINLTTGQNGLFSAALFAWGLRVLPRRPVLAGSLFGLFVCKPQLALLLPVALIAGREGRAVAAAAASAAVLLGASTLAFGWSLWPVFLARADLIRQAVMQNGPTWPFMPSVFVLAQHAGLPAGPAYAVQGVALALCVLLVGVTWARARSGPAANAVLLLCTVLASPYVQNYDLAILAPVVIWLWPANAPPPERGRMLLVATPLVLAPFLVPMLALSTGFQPGCLLVLPALWFCRRRQRPTRSSATAPHRTADPRPPPDPRPTHSRPRHPR